MLRLGVLVGVNMAVAVAHDGTSPVRRDKRTLTVDADGSMSMTVVDSSGAILDAGRALPQKRALDELEDQSPVKSPIARSQTAEATSCNEFTGISCRWIDCYEWRQATCDNSTGYHKCICEFPKCAHDGKCEVPTPVPTPEPTVPPCLEPKDVMPPWTDMNTVVPDATEESQCEACGKDLEKDGFLETGWTCVRRTSLMGFGADTWNIKRDATGGTLNKLSPETTFKVDDPDADGAGPMLIGGAPLPESLRGVFWLSKQGNMSALMSFGGPNADGGWASSGHLVGLRYRVRVLGDRVWSFAGSDSTGKWLVDKADLIYEFTFNDAKEPTFAQIHATANSYGVTVGSATEWLGDFEMTLVKGHDVYSNSVVWLRNSYGFGQEIEAKRYELIQVVDEKGQRIQPAWDEFVKVQKKESMQDPGVIHLRSSV